jgi:hypothetical protein
VEVLAVNRFFSRAWLAIAGLLLLTTRAPLAHAIWIPDGNPVCMAPGQQTLKSVASDGAGGVYVAWEDFRDPVARLVYVQRITAGGEVAPGWPVDGLLVTSAGIHFSEPRLTPDGAGGAFVAWFDQWDGYDILHTSLYLQRFDGNGARHPGWPATGLHLADGRYERLTSYTYTLEVNGIGSDAPGRCTLVYGLTSSGCHDGFCLGGGSLSSKCVDGSGVVVSDLALDYCSSSGGLSGPMLPDGGTGALAAVIDDCRGGYVMVHGTTGGVTITTLGPGSWPPFPKDLMSDGAGGSYALLSLSSGVRLLRLTSSGSPVSGWSAGGVSLPIPGGSQGLEITDGSSGAIVCWRGTSGLRALRVATDGTTPAPWPPEGAALTAAPAAPKDLAAVSDGAGGLFAVWDDARSSDGKDIYATHARGDGTLDVDTPESGFRVCAATGSQLSPLLAATGSGSAIAVWTDYRDGDSGPSNLYAQRLPLDRAVPTQVSVVSAEAVDGGAHLVWQLGEGALRVTLQRRTVESDWVDLALLDADGTGRIVYEDHSPVAGERFGYRLQFGDHGACGEAWVTMPRGSLALRGFLPNPASGRPVVGLTLGSSAPARLEVLEVTGRRVLTRDVTGFGIGLHEVPLGGARPLAPGLYLVRLYQAGEVRTARGLVLR